MNNNYGAYQYNINMSQFDKLTVTCCHAELVEALSILCAQFIQQFLFGFFIFLFGYHTFIF